MIKVYIRYSEIGRPSLETGDGQIIEVSRTTVRAVVENRHPTPALLRAVHAALNEEVSIVPNQRD